jgi:hypothetical protein
MTKQSSNVTKKLIILRTQMNKNYYVNMPMWQKKVSFSASHISSYSFSVCYFCGLKAARFNGGIRKQYFQIFLAS